MEAGVYAAQWVVGKALSSLSGGVLEAWAASRELGPNVDAVKMQLLYAQAILDNARGREIRSHALTELLQKLRQLAYDADDVLDELDYFRIQDELEGTYEAAVDADARGCLHGLVLNARHTAKDVAKWVGFSSCSGGGRDDPDKPGEAASRRVLCGADMQLGRCMRGLPFRARHAVRAVGKRLLCSSSSLPVPEDDNGDNDDDTLDSDMSRNARRLLCGACPCKAPPWRRRSQETPKLEFERADMSRRMKHIVEHLQPVCAKVFNILNLELLGSNRNTAQDIAIKRPITTSESIEPKVYGRDPMMNDIVKDITLDKCSGENLSVLPIVGPGGIGKTTLTQYIYNNQGVKDHFQVTIWICVSLNFNVFRLTQEIVNSIPQVEGEKNGRDHGQQNLDQLQKLIEHRLKSKRFLLVLDDMWKCDDDEWRRLLLPFTKGEVKGSAILVTTRFLEIAEKVKTIDHSINLEGLDDKSFWSFFLACVFGDKQPMEDHHTNVLDSTNQSPEQYYHKLLDIGEKIVQKLKRSPLAAKTVGRLLRNHLTLDHWQKVLESKEWELQTSDHDIMPALKLSYDYLPFHLQQCFSYCALFPDDYQFDSAELIRLWIGLGVLQSDGQNKRIEDVGLIYLSDLVNYGFFKKDENGRDTHYVIHDLLRELALKVSSYECLSIDCSNTRSTEISPFVRHLSIIVGDADENNIMVKEYFEKEMSKVDKILKYENMHTLMLFGQYEASFTDTLCNLFREAKALRVLCLPRMPYSVEHILHNFSKLVHLRYLSLRSGSTLLLPKTLSKFYHLRILDLKNWYGPPNVPTDMSNLVKLRHFLVYYDELHSNISEVGKLQFLQELRRFEVRKESNGFELRQLGQLKEIGGLLGIYSLENTQAREEADEAKLISKNRLQKLILDWNINRSKKEPSKEEQIIESFQPHSNLQELCIRGHGGRICPTWLGSNLSIKNLESLRLNGVAWNTFPPLGELYLLNESGEEYDGCVKDQIFQNLKRIELVSLPKLKKWVGRNTHNLFSLIEAIIIEECPELMELSFSYDTSHPPEQDGSMHWFSRLRKLRITNCPKLSLLRPVPWTHTISDVEIINVGLGLDSLIYQKDYSSQLFLKMVGNKYLYSLEKVLTFHNLVKLEKLELSKCPPLKQQNLLKLTLLKTLKIENCALPLGRWDDVNVQLPIEYLDIRRCDASGKELMDLLSCCHMLSTLEIYHCENIKRLGVEPQTTTVTMSRSLLSLATLSSSSPSADENKIDAQPEQQPLQQEIEEDVEGSLLFPLCLSKSLRNLRIEDCREISLMVSPSPDTTDYKAKAVGASGVGRTGLQGLHSLQSLYIWSCPKFLSSYSASSGCPFPSSLQTLRLRGVSDSIETMAPFSNLTSLTFFSTWDCGDFRGEGLQHLLTQGHLTTLAVFKSPRFFVGCESWKVETAAQQEEENPSHCYNKLQELVLRTDDIAGVLVAPVCDFLSSSLSQLSFWFNAQVERFTGEQEEALRHLTSLQHLQFWECDKLQSLPASLHKLTTLKRLQIWSCYALRSLPKEGLPSSLQELHVDYACSEELKEQCRKLKGRIPKIRVE